MGGDLYSGRLIFEQLVTEFWRDAKLRKAMPSLLCEVISDFDVDVIGRDDLVARPTLLDDLDQLGGDIDAPFIVPTGLQTILASFSVASPSSTSMLSSP